MAKRDKLTKNQQRQVAKQQTQRLTEKTIQLDELSESKEGLLISRYGEQADVLDPENKQTFRCYLRQNLGAPVPGDNVSFRIDKQNQGIIEAIFERTSLLERPTRHQGVKPIVANIDHIYIVIAPLPDFSSILLDRYLIAVHNSGIDCTIVANKWDLTNEIESQEIDAFLKVYQNLGYPILKTSTKQETGIDQLASLAKNQRAILVGQSGVGKSSLINQLFPEQQRAVQVVSENSRLGQHTTTSSQLFMFEDSKGFIVDSPGVRDFNISHLEPQSIIEGYIEFQPYLGLCKFRNCQHINEPACEILKAVESQNIERLRWQNYCKIMTDLSQI